MLKKIGFMWKWDRLVTVSYDEWLYWETHPLPFGWMQIRLGEIDTASTSLN